MIEQEKVYSEVDVNGLSTVLAEDMWKTLTENVDLIDLYENGEDGLVRDNWARSFFDLKEGYLHLIAHYKKPEDGTTEDRTVDYKGVSL